MTVRASLTPSLLDGPLLERLFVNREPLLAQAMAHVADAAADLTNLSPYLPAALQKTDSPESRLSESLLAQWPSPTLQEPSDDPAVVAQTERIDDALASLQHEGSALAVLALPVALSSLIEARLANESVGLLRIELALVALQSGGGKQWLTRAIDAIAAVHPDEQLLATIDLGACRAWARSAGQ